MQSNMAGITRQRSRISDITICPICLKNFNDPRSLPCIHSFCLQCLQGHFNDNCFGDDVQCPLCRKEFQIPEDGLQTLPYNFFLQNLVDAKTSKKQAGTSSCEPCTKEGRTKSATVFCVDCNQKLCDRCSASHINWRGGAHHVVPAGDRSTSESIRLPGSFCDEHRDSPLEFYCFDCHSNICADCLTASHQEHECKDIQKVSEEFVATMKSDIRPFPSRISQFRKSVNHVELASEKFLANVKKMEAEVRRKGDEMKRLVDDHVDKLIQELNEMKVSSVGETKTRVEGYKSALAALESFQTYCSQLASKGSACDITRAANDLHARAQELLQTYVTSAEYRPPILEFVPTDVQEVSKGQNIVGSVLTSGPRTDVRLQVSNARKRETSDQSKVRLLPVEYRSGGHPHASEGGGSH